jgi:hypothetical protein
MTGSEVRCGNPSCAKIIRPRSEAIVVNIPVGAATYQAYYCSETCRDVIERRREAARKELAKGLPVLKFSHDWTKLNDRIFTTIRKPHDPYDRPEGEIFDVISPTKRFEAILLFSIQSPIQDLSTDLLCHDTDTVTREQALATLNGFYKIPPTIVQLMLLRRLRWCNAT